jgi:hypothetical protein
MREIAFVILAVLVAASCGESETGGAGPDAGDTDTDTGPVGNWECYDGSFVIESAADSEELAKYLCVTEDLTVTGEEITSLSLPKLKKVQGSFTLAAPNLASLELPELTEVGGTLRVEGRSSPTSRRSPSSSRWRRSGSTGATP